MVAPSIAMKNNSNFIALDIQLQHLLFNICSQILSVSNEIWHFEHHFHDLYMYESYHSTGSPLMTTLIHDVMYSPNEMQVHQLIADEIEINWDAVELCDDSYTGNHTEISPSDSPLVPVTWIQRCNLTTVRFIWNTHNMTFMTWRYKW